MISFNKFEIKSAQWKFVVIDIICKATFASLQNKNNKVNPIFIMSREINKILEREENTTGFSNI